MKKLPFFMLLFLVGCTRIPEGIKPVDQFEVNRYLGKWHEIARLDHSFERGLSRVTAEYSLRDDGGIKVLNRGWSDAKNSWKEAQGKAYFVNAMDQGHLKVSFFGPFYGSYVIFKLDRKNYQYAVVCGPDKSYLWILARTPQISDDLLNELKATAAAKGFDTNKLILVKP